MSYLVRVLGLALVLITIFPVLSGGIQRVVHSQQSGEVVFRVGWGGTSFDTFNQFTTYAQISLWATTNVYDTLVRFDKSYTSFIPDLAESWSMNSTTVVFHLVRNATFHDGVRVTAEDVKYSFELASADWSRLSPNVEVVESIHVIDDYTIAFRCKSSAMFMLMAATAIPIVPKHVWERVSDPSTYPDCPPIGSGPFTVTDYKEGQYIVLEKYRGFFRKSWLPKVDKIIIAFYSDVTSAANALRAGDIDAVGPYIPVAMVEEIQANPNMEVVVAPGVMYFYLAFNMYPEGKGNPTLRDLNVRKALAHAVNVSYVAELAWHGYARAIATVVPTSNAFYHSGLKPYKFDLKLASKILDDAGYVLGQDGVRRAPDGTPMSYKLLVPSNMPEAIRAAQEIAKWWAQIGVSAEVEAMDTGSMAAIIWTSEDDTTTLGHDMDIWDWFLTPGDPTFLSIFLSNQVIMGTSDSGYVNATYDAMYEEMLSAPDVETVKQIAWQMQEMLYRDLPYLPLYEVLTPQAYVKTFTGFEHDWPGGPFGGYDWTVFLKVQPVMPQTTTPVTSPATTPTTSPATTPTVPAEAFPTTLVAGVIIVIAIVIIALVLLRRR
ncbi:MAG: ABC transporter substrate-binding protein [Zestosphaera sp.]